MHWKKVYLDIECTYTGSYNPDKKEERGLFFKDYPNWKFYAEKELDGKKIEYKGIIGMFILELDLDVKTNVYKITNKTFVQLIGKGCTKENLMKRIDGLNEIVGYHCRTKTDWRGYTGYDFGVIAAQFGIVLDELPGVDSTDLELYCHRAGMYGGLKEVEKNIPNIPPRTSGVNSGAEEEKLLLEIAACEDEEKKKEMWKKAKGYNREDVMNLLHIERYLRDIKIIEIG